MMSLASIARPTPDWPTVLVLSDYFQDTGRQQWADALRWMARRTKWPRKVRLVSEHEEAKYWWTAGDEADSELPRVFFFGRQTEVFFGHGGYSSNASALYLSVRGDEDSLIEQALVYFCRMREVREKEILFYLELTGDL